MSKLYAVDPKAVKPTIVTRYGDVVTTHTLRTKREADRLILKLIKNGFTFCPQGADAILSEQA